MNGKRFLLDTNIVIGLFSSESSIIEKLKLNPVSVFVPSIVIGELYYGAQQSSKMEENQHRIKSFAQDAMIFPCDQETGAYYGKIKSQLKKRGTPIPENDIWIAAIAMQHKFTMVTRDKHFHFINEIEIERW